MMIFGSKGIRRNGVMGVFVLIALFASTLWGRDLFRNGELIITLKQGRDIGQVERRHNLVSAQRLASTRTWRVRLRGEGDALQRLHEIERDSDVVRGELNYLHFAPEALQESVAFVDQESVAFVDGQSPVEFFGQDSALRIQLAQAHQRATGRGVTIATIDTGVDPTHPAIQSRLVPGWDFIQSDASPVDEPGGIAYGHGTFVAGILALVAPDARIMPLRALNPSGVGDTFTIARAIYFAADRGVQVLNLSLGMTKPSHVIEDALTYAAGRGVAIIASAGNNNSLQPQYPAHSKMAMAVAAVNHTDRKAAFSNYGIYISVSAPGVEIYSAYPNHRFALWSGTSFATAFASGTAALIRSLTPTLWPRAVIRRLEGSADNIDALNPTFAHKLGEGRINCFQALRP